MHTTYIARIEYIHKYIFRSHTYHVSQIHVYTYRVKTNEKLRFHPKE